MTWALSNTAMQATFPAEKGLSQRAMRHILAAMAKIAQSDGTFRYGLRASKLATLADYSLSVIRHFERVALKLGIIERVEVGGGRKATKWRINLTTLMAYLPEKARLQPAPKTAPPRKKHGSGAHAGWLSGLLGGHGTKPRQQTLSLLTGDPTTVHDTCTHGSDAGTQPTTGLPRCPTCRHQTLTTLINATPLLA